MDTVDSVSVVYKILMEYVPKKESLTAADHVLSVLVDIMDEEEVAEFVSHGDAPLKAAFKEYDFDDDDDDEYDDY